MSDDELNRYKPPSESYPDMDDFDDMASDDVPPMDDAARQTVLADGQRFTEVAGLGRETVVADPQKLEEATAAARQTVAIIPTEVPLQRHGSRTGFDERLEQVKSRQPQSPSAPRPRRRLITPGCLATFLLLSIVSGIFLLIALFLPPLSDYNPLVEIISGGSGSFVSLTADDRRAEKAGLVLEVQSNDVGVDFGVNILTAENYLAGEVPAEGWKCPPADNLPALSEIQGTPYSIETSGTAPQRIGLTVEIPDASADLYGWFPAATAWQFIPAQKSTEGNKLVTSTLGVPQCVLVTKALAGEAFVGATLDLGQSLNPDVTSSLDRLYIKGLMPTLQGNLQGILPGEVSTTDGYAVFPLIANYSDPAVVDVNTVSTILGNSALRLNHSANIAAFAEANQYAGVAIDYREVPVDLRNQFSDFVYNLGRALHLQNRTLIVVVPPATFNDGWSGGAYDWRALGQFADEVIVLAPLNPESFTEGGELDAMLTWAVGEVDRHKLFLGLSAMNVEVVPQSSAALVPYDAAWQGIDGVSFQPNVAAVPPNTTLQANLNSPYVVDLNINEAVQTPYLSYALDGNILRTYWFTTDAALNFRVKQVLPFNMAGVVVFDIHASGIDPAITAALTAYQTGTTGDYTPESIAMRWTVSNAGTVVSEQEVTPGTPILYQVTGSDTELEFSVSVVGDFALRIGSGIIKVDAAASVPEVQPTAQAPQPTQAATQAPQITPTSDTSQGAVAQVSTPTPTIAAVEAAQVVEPTKEPKPTQMPTIVPTINAPEVQGFLPAEFEIGAHITGDYDRELLKLMKVGGMNWIKLQIRYERGMNADDYGWQVQLMQENQFKVLWGVVGNKDEVLTAGYAEEYAAFVARLAEIGSNAIEIWNEVNLDREWPNGQIDPALYTQFLKISYEAIKAKNPNTMVISAALAPTGFFGGCSPAGCDDHLYYQGLANAGAAQYMDCVGAHYNEGIISPTLNSGDPRNNDYPTRYLQGQTARAYDPFGGAVPVCYTELGYLSPEGYGQLPAGFEWAQNVTVAQQASWLGSAALLNAQSGKVKLMIIWNLDYKVFETDPAAGYAIIRPDGGCPACDTLGSLRAVQPVIGGNQ